MRIVTHATLERVTKGAVRYQEVTEEGDVVEREEQTITQLYLRKTCLEGDIPSGIVVTIEEWEVAT